MLQELTLKKNKCNVGEQLENTSLHFKSLEELETMLEEALRNEDYLKAAQIRDEMDKR